MREQNTTSDEVITDKPKHNNGSSKRKNTGDAPSIPGLDLRELYAERNWTALAGLALFALAGLWALQSLLGIDLQLWSLALLGIGGWLVFQSWTASQGDFSRLDESARHRLLAGAGMIAIGALSMIHFDWWALLLIGAGGWLGYDTWQRHESVGRIWTRQTRNRMFMAAALGLLGLSSLISMGSAWLLLIIIGAAMLYGRVGKRHCG